LLQDTSVDSDDGAVKVKHSDNPFIEQMHPTTIVDMNGKLGTWCQECDLTDVTACKMATTPYKISVILCYTVFS